MQPYLLTGLNATYLREARGQCVDSHKHLRWQRSSFQSHQCHHDTAESAEQSGNTKQDVTASNYVQINGDYYDLHCMPSLYT